MESINYIILTLIFAIFPIIAGGIIRKVRARAQGRKGPPLLQNFYDLNRSLKKKPVDGFNSGFFAEVSPMLVCISGAIMWSIAVFEWTPFILIPFFLALQRVAITSFAMETGSSFGGLGTSREILLSISSEPILLLSILVAQSKMQLSFSWVGIILGVLFLGALMVAVLAELARPPFDDPRTHLELTMVHEAMLLEASGKTLGLFELGYQLKISTLFVLVVRIGLEHSRFIDRVISKPMENAITFFGAIGIAVIVGYWESISVRRKWTWIPEVMGITLLFILVLGTLVKL
ncbi:MAG: NADH-quinone oxidoreductase subunit H [Leptospiraceae bacterium]|nr:NADH-quinone oxidoreductase subunit H [Leptospiraceae bacterium]